MGARAARGLPPLWTMEEIDGIEVDLDLLPDALSHLAPLIRQSRLVTT